MFTAPWLVPGAKACFLTRSSEELHHAHEVRGLPPYQGIHGATKGSSRVHTGVGVILVWLRLAFMGLPQVASGCRVGSVSPVRRTAVWAGAALLQWRCSLHSRSAVCQSLRAFMGQPKVPPGCSWGLVALSLVILFRPPPPFMGFPQATLRCRAGLGRLAGHTAAWVSA